MDFSAIPPPTLVNLAWLGAGFLLGLLVCAVMVRTFGLFFSTRFRDMSDQALYRNADRFAEMADRYFKGYVREARRDFTVQGDELRRSIDPVRQTLTEYERRLAAMEARRERASGAISERLAEMGRVQQLLHAETGNLVKALRLPHVRGRWGEITLKKVAELAGMSQYCDFSEQVTNGTGRGRLRPDMIVTLPSDRRIVVDAKVPLMAYLDALEATDEAEQEARMADHARQVAAHINQLSAKRYAQAFSPTPEFVVLFIPGENFFSAALNQQPDLIEKGMQKGVVLATPTTFIALLKSVDYAWQQQKGIENAEEIRTLGARLYRRIATMAEGMNRLGRDIEKCAASFNRAVGSMESRVMPPARKLADLGMTAPGPLESPNPAEAAVKSFKKRTEHDT